MKKIRLLLQFDNTEAKNAFVIFMQGAWNDISSYLKQHLKQKGVESDPSLLIEEGKDKLHISILSKNKGFVLVTPKTNVLETKLYDDVINEDKYAVFNNNRLDIFIRKSGGSDLFIGAAPSIDSLAKQLFDFVDPAIAAEETKEKDTAIMKVVEDTESVETAEPSQVKEDSENEEPISELDVHMEVVKNEENV